jgi:2-dehydro-3-deoxyphosphogluconate aldolase/(4S)-4-hydroxy-2-oxoglutarate aldolase
MSPLQDIDRLLANTLIPVVRTTQTELAERAIDLLKRAGYTTFEITLTIPAATRLIGELSAEAGITVGAGTVTNANEAQRCLDAGAQFLVSPIAASELPPIAQAARVPLLLSGLTPNEVHHAWQLGADAVKVFPASSIGGPAHLRALRSVFPQIPLVPTGGVTLDNLRDYLNAGARAIGVGSDLINDHSLLHATDENWIARASAYRKAAIPATQDLAANVD